MYCRLTTTYIIYVDIKVGAAGKNTKIKMKIINLNTSLVRELGCMVVM